MGDIVHIFWKMVGKSSLREVRFDQISASTLPVRKDKSKQTVYIEIRRQKGGLRSGSILFVTYPGIIHTFIDSKMNSLNTSISKA